MTKEEVVEIVRKYDDLVRLMLDRHTKAPSVDEEMRRYCRFEMNGDAVRLLYPYEGGLYPGEESYIGNASLEAGICLLTMTDAEVLEMRERAAEQERIQSEARNEQDKEARERAEFWRLKLKYEGRTT